MAGPTVAPVFTASLRISNATYVLTAVGEQARDFLDTTKYLNDSMQAVHALRRQKTAGLLTNQKAWIDQQIRNTEKALSDAAALIELARVDAQPKANRTRDPSLMSRTNFVLKESSKVAMHQTQMTLAYHGLNAAIRMLYGDEGHSSSTILQSGIVKHTPKGTMPPSRKSPPTYELSEFMNRRRRVSGDKQREGLHQTMLTLKTAPTGFAEAAQTADHGRRQLRSHENRTNSEQILTNTDLVELEGETEFVKSIQARPELDTVGVRYLDGLQSDSAPACIPIVALGGDAPLIGHGGKLSIESLQASSIDSWTQGTLEAMERQRNSSSPNLTPQNSSVSLASPVSPAAEVHQMLSNDTITNMPVLDSPYYIPRPHHTRLPSTQANLPPPVTQPSGLDIAKSLHASGSPVPGRSSSYQTPVSEDIHLASTKQTSPQHQRIFPLQANESPPPFCIPSTEQIGPETYNVVDRTPRQSSHRSSKSFNAVELPGGVEISPTKAWPDAVELPATVPDTRKIPPSRPSHTVRDKFPFLIQSPEKPPEPRSSPPPPPLPMVNNDPVPPYPSPSAATMQSQSTTQNPAAPIQRRVSKLSKLQKPPRPSKPSHLQNQAAVSPTAGSLTARVFSPLPAGPVAISPAPVPTPLPSISPPIPQNRPAIYQSQLSNDKQPTINIPQRSSTPGTGPPTISPSPATNPLAFKPQLMSQDIPELSQKQSPGHLQPQAMASPRSNSPSSRHTVPLVTRSSKVLPPPQLEPAPYDFPALTQAPTESTHRQQTSSTPYLQPPISYTPGRSSPVSHRSSSPAALSQPSNRSSSPAIVSAPERMSHNPVPTSHSPVFINHSPTSISPTPASPELAQQLQQPNYPFYKPSSPGLAPQELHSQTYPPYKPASPSLKQTEIQDQNAPFYKELPATPLDYTRILSPPIHTLDHSRALSVSSINLPSEPWHTSIGRQSRGRKWLEHQAEKAAIG